MMLDDVPAARDTGLRVLDSIIEIENLVAPLACHALDDLVELRVRLHRAVFVGEHVAVEIREEREVSPDM